MYQAVEVAAHNRTSCFKSVTKAIIIIIILNRIKHSRQFSQMTPKSQSRSIFLHFNFGLVWIPLVSISLHIVYSTRRNFDSSKTDRSFIVPWQNGFKIESCMIRSWIVYDLMLVFFNLQNVDQCWQIWKKKKKRKTYETYNVKQTLNMRTKFFIWNDSIWSYQLT